jgi:hypothetical protein
MHIQGRAVDIRIPGDGLESLHRAALALRAGGVGYYPRSNFVHVDTGPVRTWGGHDEFEDTGDAPEWRDALLSETPQTDAPQWDAGRLNVPSAHQASNTALPSPGGQQPAPAIDMVTPRTRPVHAGDAGATVTPARPVAWPNHKPVRLAGHGASPVQSEGFWVRRKPRLVAGG